LIAGAVTGDFSQRDEIVFAFDREKAFRLFVAESVLYFDKSLTLDIYVVPILKLEDVGDPKTTVLSKGLEAGLRYRALFLERTSPFSPAMFKYAGPSDFRKMVSELLRELRLLLVRSDQAKLGQRDNLVWLFGTKDESVNEVLEMTELWNQQKELLYNAAETALVSSTPDRQQRESFARQVQEFCEKTRSINATWLKKVMDTLTEILLAEPRPREDSPNVTILQPNVRRAAGTAASQE
jgi:hypothetical protein